MYILVDAWKAAAGAMRAGRFDPTNPRMLARKSGRNGEGVIVSSIGLSIQDTDDRIQSVAEDSCSTDLSRRRWTR